MFSTVPSKMLLQGSFHVPSIDVSSKMFFHCSLQLELLFDELIPCCRIKEVVDDSSQFQHELVLSLLHYGTSRCLLLGGLWSDPFCKQKLATMGGLRKECLSLLDFLACFVGSGQVVFF